MSGAALTESQVIGALIARRRKTKGILQSELAQVISVKQTWISRLERGLIEATPTQLLALCEWLAIEPETVDGLPMLTRSDDERQLLTAYRRIQTEGARERAFLVVNSIGALQENASC